MTTVRSCAEIRTLLADMVDDAIDPILRGSVERHLSGCPECAREVRALRHTRDLLRMLPPMRLGEDRRSRLLAEFRKQRPAKIPARIAPHHTALTDSAKPLSPQSSPYRFTRPKTDA